MESRVTRYAVLSRLGILAAASVFGNWITDYDTSAAIGLANKSSVDKTVNALLVPLSNWDGQYFIKIAESSYQHEQAHAFYPLFPILMRMIGYLLHFCTSGILDLRTCILLAGVLISNGSFVFASRELYKLTKLLSNSTQFAFTAALLFCFNPAGVFFSAIYTESLFALASFSTLVYLYKERYFRAAWWLAMACLTRSNGAILLLYFGLHGIASLSRVLFDESPWENIQRCVKLGLCIICGLSAAALVQWYGWFLYCQPHNTSLGKSPWCDNTLPLIYGYIQSHYWDVGLFRYYQMKQIPNFLLAAPITAISCCGIMQYFRDVVFPSTDTRRAVVSVKHSPFYLHWAFLLLTAVLTMNIQVATRFIAASCPPLYWWAATQFHQENSSLSQRLLLAYFVMYIILGVLLFCNFYPWT